MSTGTLPGRLARGDVDLATDFPRSVPIAAWRQGHVAESTACRSAWEILWALCGSLAVKQASGLTDLDEISVGVSHVAADFRSPIDRRRHELRPFRLPLLVAGLDVGDSQIHEH